jgi:hypothetical protein
VKECGVYRVVDKRDYRAHKQGEEFVALLDPKAEHRAVMRGSIERIGTVVPRPENYMFPDGWLEGGK